MYLRTAVARNPKKLIDFLGYMAVIIKAA